MDAVFRNSTSETQPVFIDHEDGEGNATDLDVDWLSYGHAWGDAFWALRVLVAALTVLMNTSIGGAFLIQYLRRRKPVKQSGIFVLNLLLGDTTASVIPLAYAYGRTLGFTYCGLTIGLDYLGAIGNHITLILVHFDRCMVSSQPLKHRILMTKTRCKIMVGCGWLIPITGLLVGAIYNLPGEWVQGCCNQLPGVTLFLTWATLPSYTATTLCLVTIQCKTYLHLRRQDAQMLQLQDAEMLQRRDAKMLDQQRSRITARIFFWLAVPTCISLVLYLLIILWTRTMWTTDPCFKSYLGFILVAIGGVLEMLGDLSIFMNVLVYSYKTKSIRTPVEQLWNDAKKLLCSVGSSLPRPKPGVRQGAASALAESSI